VGRKLVRANFTPVETILRAVAAGVKKGERGPVAATCHKMRGERRVARGAGRLCVSPRVATFCLF